MLTLDIVPFRENLVSEALRYGTRCHLISQFTYIPTRLSANGKNQQYARWWWCDFTDRPTAVRPTCNAVLQVR